MNTLLVGISLTICTQSKIPIWVSLVFRSAQPARAHMERAALFGLTAKPTGASHNTETWFCTSIKKVNYFQHELFSM